MIFLKVSREVFQKGFKIKILLKSLTKDLTKTPENGYGNFCRK